MKQQLVAASLAIGMGLAGVPIVDAHASTPSSGPAITDPSSVLNAVSGAAIVDTALRYVGYPYTTVGNSPAKGFSCIGFVSYVYGANGIALPDDLWMAQAYAPAVPFSSLLPGDILYFQNTVWKGISHTAIYLGGGRFVHAEWYNRGVVISSFNYDPVDGNYWIGKYLGANRPWTGPAGTPSVPTAVTTVSGSGVTPTATAAGGTAAVVAVAALNVRSAPAKTGEVLQIIARGTQVSVLEHQGDWYHVQMPDGTSGWVVTLGLKTVALVPNTGNTVPSASRQAEAPPPTVHSIGSAQITVSALRVHKAPALTAQVVSVLLKGQQVAVLGHTGLWAQVRLIDGTVGWVSAPLLGFTFPVMGHGTLTAPVRVHRTPALKAPVLTVAPAGTKVQILGKQSTWTQVKLPAGLTGYVWSAYVK